MRCATIGCDNDAVSLMLYRSAHARDVNALLTAMVCDECAETYSAREGLSVEHVHPLVLS